MMNDMLAGDVVCLFLLLLLMLACANATFVRHVRACTASGQALTEPRIVLSWRKALPLGQGSTKHDHHLSPESKTLVLDSSERTETISVLPPHLLLAVPCNSA